MLLVEPRQEISVPVSTPNIPFARRLSLLALFLVCSSVNVWSSAACSAGSTVSLIPMSYQSMDRVRSAWFLALYGLQSLLIPVYARRESDLYDNDSHGPMNVCRMEREREREREKDRDRYRKPVVEKRSLRDDDRDSRLIVKKRRSAEPSSYRRADDR